MQNFRPYIYPRVPAAPPPNNNLNPNFPAFNGTQFIPTRQPPFSHTHLFYRAISPSQQTPPRIFAYTGANTSIPSQPAPAPFNQNAPQIQYPADFHNPQAAPAPFNQNAPQIQHPAGFHNPQGRPQQPHPCLGYPIYRSDQANSSDQPPESQVRINTEPPPSLPQNTTYPTTQNQTPAYIAIPTTAYPMTGIDPHQTYAYEATKPERDAVNAERKKPEKIDPGTSTLNPNTAEFFPGKTWNQPDNKKFEKKNITKGSTTVVEASTPLKNSKGEPNEASASPTESRETPPSEPHSPTASIHQESKKTPSTIKKPPEPPERLSSPLKERHRSNSPGSDSKEVDKTPENNTSRPTQEYKLDSKANTLLVAANNDESSGMVADETRQTEAASPIPSEPVATKKTVEHGTDGEVKGAEVSAIAQRPVLPDSPVESTDVHEFISDGSCRPKEKTRGKPVAQLSISVQEVLNLKLKKKEPQEHPKELDLLYLKTFNFKKKRDLLVDIDASELQKKGQTQSKKQALKSLNTELRNNSYKGKTPEIKDIERMYSPDKLLSPPESTVDIHVYSRRLREVA
nr:hypothetical protein [Endozoicomonas sp.]